MAHDWKSCWVLKPSRVQIPHPPPPTRTNTGHHDRARSCRHSDARHVSQQLLPVGHPCLYLMSTSDQRSPRTSPRRRPRIGATTSRAPLRTVAAAVKFAEPASQVARLAAALRDKRR